MDFDSQDPFPLVALDSLEKTTGRVHANLVDRFLGLQFAETEALVRNERTDEDMDDFETWSHLGPEIFMTPYSEFRALAEYLQPQPDSVVVDLGAAYCRLAFVLNRHFPTVNFIGVEYVARRVYEARRLFKMHGLARAQALCANLLDETFAIPAGDLYFIYDCGATPDVRVVIDRVIAQVKRAQKPVRLVGRGRRVHDVFAELGWLANADRHPTFSVVSL